MCSLWKGFDQSEFCNGHGQRARQGRQCLSWALLSSQNDERLGEKMITFLLMVIVTLLFIIYWLCTRIFVLTGTNMMLMKLRENNPPTDEDVSLWLNHVPIEIIYIGTLRVILGQNGVKNYVRK